MEEGKNVKRNYLIAGPVKAILLLLCEVKMSMTKFECAVDAAWGNLNLGENDYLPRALSAGLDAVELLREYYEAYRSGSEVSLYVQGLAHLLLEEWDK